MMKNEKKDEYYLISGLTYRERKAFKKNTKLLQIKLHWGRV